MRQLSSELESKLQKLAHRVGFKASQSHIADIFRPWILELTSANVLASDLERLNAENERRLAGATPEEGERKKDL